MKTLKFRFKDANNVSMFVAESIRQDFDIDLEHGKLMVDAKSLMGVMNIAHSEWILLCGNTTDSWKFENYVECINEFIEKL